MRDLDIQCCVSLTWQIRKTSRVPSWWHLLCKACHPSLVRAKLEIKTQAYLKYLKLYHRQNWFPHVMLRRNWQRPDKQLFCNCLYWKTQPTEMLRHFILSGLFSCSSSITWPFRHQFCCQNPSMSHPGHQVTPWAHFLPFQAPASTLGQRHTQSRNKPWPPPPSHTGEHVRRLNWSSAPATDLQNSSTFLNCSPQQQQSHAILSFTSWQ